MASHTPGPWAVHPVRAQVDAFATGVPEPICQFLWPTTVRSEAETEANAHLIAAAPELLAGLKIATDCACANLCSHLGGTTYHSAECERIRAAIAKAEPSHV